MAQRISRAKAKLRDLAEPFALPAPGDLAGRTQSVLHVLYLMFNEAYATSAGPELGRPDLAGEAIRLTRMLLEGRPDEPEVEGLLALMLLSESRRPARTAADGSLVPMAEQDRSSWNREMITEGLVHAASALGSPPSGPYALMAAVNALHAEAPSHEATRWADIASLYERLEGLTGNPVVRLNRAVAVAMMDGPEAALDLLAEMDGPLRGHHRLASVRAHLYEQLGNRDAAVKSFRFAAAHSANLRERDYLLIQAARVHTYGCHA